MAVDWTPHRFSGGTIALDTTNTVVLRGDPMRGFDRFADRTEIGRFAEAASPHRARELAGRRLRFEPTRDAETLVVELREAIDRLFRQAAVNGTYAASGLATLLDLSARALASSDERLGGTGRPFGDKAGPVAFEAALAMSAIALLPVATSGRVRVCSNCGWLFLDASRNRSRIWCDMAVCGNRQKARRHYRRQRDGEVRHA